jgi:5'(3')-deoxyribonucleotidase
MEIKKIYFDMDGVLADFDNGVRELLHLEPMPQGFQKDEYQTAMWTKMKEYGHFYRDLKPLPHALESFAQIYSDYGDRCEILTGVPKPKRGIIYAGDDKVNWVHKYLSEKVRINLVLRKEKLLSCLGKEYILIDDYGITVKEWNSLGGTGILHTDWDSTEKALQAVI